MLLYDVTIVLTAMMAGFMLSYCLTIGRYFNYLLETAKYDGFSAYYSPFRREKRVPRQYAVCVLGQFIMAVLSLFFSWQSGTWLARMGAVLPLLLLLAAHRLTGFGESEEEINSGRMSETMRRIYLKWNLPLHFSYFLLYFAASLFLIWSR
ncbi:hypothetical protein AB3329_05320 [Streptococcus sp. H31]|uniref:hypothetical protein n=1 Tax=Streptococcus huangxiaojuni TaxID=3237239 RepID=UPI0034A4C323